MEYLAVAKKLQNILAVPIPNLKHAPVSLAGALKEYLEDPNFEQNRIEYAANLKATSSEGGRRRGEKFQLFAAGRFLTIKLLGTSPRPTGTANSQSRNSELIFAYFLRF